ncbi:MAG: Fructosamine-3-kinase [Candidatus Accumulibacter appositus]|uniref:Fructosamine-3-kinase n=1 Tax=Candidatus Accumulibacter appositus TaxID=1454003 RepID=A0A011PUW2_9PROT|nr:fructosamine kinase family protein [Accumulibacter sp.]EXI80610.1 MAG: Fructosamine-3-kinase [Candidatus Accumulibacter appositus]HRF05609.1 fructosamine kinase family protein [Accumulibacter sp.]
MKASLAMDTALGDALRALIAGDAESESKPQPAGIDAVTPIGGGSISRTLLIESGQRRCFVKLHDPGLLDMFVAEADGLRALAACPALRVPRVVGHGRAGGHAYLVLEHLRLHGLREAQEVAAAGRSLAELHRITGQQYGWHRDNFIGSTPQLNTGRTSWPAFFATQRLQAQLALAAAGGHHGRLIAEGEQLAENLATLFADQRPTASLLHGDLWSGNAAIDETGRLTLFDPAVHFGDRECDLAMSELFGGFPESFYAAYREAWPVPSGYAQRRTLYQLYHVLNHLNLFGSGYLRQAQAMIASLLAEIGH